MTKNTKTLTGRPILTDPKLLPLFPTTLPNGVRPDLMITLGPLTRDQIIDTYMEIERPPEVLPHAISLGVPTSSDVEKKEASDNKFFTLNQNSNELNLTLPGTYSPQTMQQLTSDQLYSQGPINSLAQFNIKGGDDEKTNDIRKENTIGEFYYTIKKALARFEEEAKKNGGTIFDKNSISKQVNNDEMDGVIVVHNLQSAFAAIGTIVDEGEGASIINLEDKQHQLSHYWKFFELAFGHRLYFNGLSWDDSDENEALKSAFKIGSKIDFDFEKDVYYDVKTYDPKTDEPNIHVDRFNTTYGNLLKALEKFLNGDKKQLKENAVPLMRQMQVEYLQSINNKYWDKPVAPNFVPIFKEK